MSLVQSLRRQHVEIRALCDSLAASLDLRSLSSDPTSATSLLGSLAGRLRSHQALEQGQLYSRLAASDDPSVLAHLASARRADGEMSALMESHLSRWSERSVVKEKPTDFVRETMALYRALKRMLDVEESEIYVLLDVTNR